MKNLAILLFILLNSTASLDAQCMINFPSRDTLLCAVPVDSFPMLTAEDISGCTVDSIRLFGTPDYDKLNCSGDPEIYAKYYRVWRIYADAGAIDSTFKDTICLEKIDLGIISFPSNVIFECSEGDTTQEIAGFPLADTVPIMGKLGHCNLWVGVSTEFESLGCPNEYKLTRTWTIMDLCNPGMMGLEETQTIHIIDTTDPSIIVIPQLEECTEVDQCGADITFPPPYMLADNCLDSAQIGLEISVFTKDPDPPFLQLADENQSVFGIPPGRYCVEYKAIDSCGNSAKDTMDLIVLDKTPPLAQGKDKVLQFNGGVNMMTIPATQFDDGSYDLCEGDDLYFKVRRLDAPIGYICANTDNPDNMFDDNIKFCCEDVDAPVMIILRVYDREPPPGPVEDDIHPNNYADVMHMVTVLDKSPPEIDCLEADTIDCNSDLFDLSRLGEPSFTDNCGASLGLDTTIYDLNECNIGCILRRWVARDSSGLTDTCTQKVFVRDETPFDGRDTAYLKWPSDVILYTCNANTDTSATGAPIIHDENSCGKIAYKYTDELYQYVENACYKILRHWKVFDWCQFDGSEYNPYEASAGFWYFTQVIKVKDTVAPVLMPIQDLTVASQAVDCGPSPAVIPPFSATDCTMPDDLVFTYKVDLGNDGNYDTTGTGNDASGVYPQGTHELHVFVNDGCGNISEETFLLTIEDQKPPSAILNGSLVAELMEMNGGGMVDVPARLFKTKSIDNCTPAEMLRYAYSADPNDSVRMFTCANLGDNQVTIYVFDEVGNFDFTINNIEIQDNMGVCGPTLVTDDKKSTVEGLIRTEKNLPVERVSIQLMQGDSATPTTTNRKGKFVFDQLSMHEKYAVIPKKEINPLNGVSTLDIVRLTKHILGTEPFDSPYQMIAGDINQSRSLTTLDVVHLRKLILGIIPHFRDNKSWEFIDAAHEFVNPENPFEDNYPTIHDIDDLSEKMIIEFIGIKLGDVNHSVKPNRLSQAQIRNKRPKSVLQVEQEDFNGLTRLNFIISNQKEFQGIQFAVNIKEDSRLVEILSDGLAGAEHMYFHQDSRQLRISWNPEISMEISNSTLFSLLFETPAHETGFNDLVQMDADLLSPELYKNDQIYEVQLQEISNPLGSANDYFELKQNEPNPFTHNTMISFRLPKDQSVSFNIYDLNGHLIHTRQMALLKGRHQIEVSSEHIPANGIYIYELKSPWHSARNKMIKVN